MTSAAKGLNVADLLEAPGLASSLRDRLQAADANGDGVISASEMIDVIQSEITATRDKKVMQRVLIALGVACLLIIAAVMGLTYAVVEMSKDTSVQNNVLVGKDGLQPLSTATLQKTVQLADLYKASSPSELDWLTHVTVPFGKGEAVLKIQNVYLVPGERARFDTAAENVSVEVTADGVTVSGDEQAPGGRRRLMQENEASASGTARVTAEGGDAGANNFYREGNTIKCPNAKRDDKGTVDGVEYTKRGKWDIRNMIHPEKTRSCTTGVTDMSFLFNLRGSFNGDISDWDTSSVTDMSYMFNNDHAFNQDISGWDTSSVTNMKSMFGFATSFNQDISGWNTAMVTTMHSMFNGATAFNQPIGIWDTALVTDMTAMFFRHTSFNQDISRWNTAQVTDMSDMFKDASAFNGDISGWDTAQVTDMEDLFNGAKAFSGDISRWDTAQVTNMRAMFKDATAFNGDISGWDTSSVTDMSYMFKDATNFNKDISNWKTSAVTDMGYMFNGAKAFSGDLSKWNVFEVVFQRNGCQNFCDKAGSLTPPDFQIYRRCGEPGCSEL